MEEKEELIWRPSPAESSESNSMFSATLGRVLHTLLAACPSKLQDAISRLRSPPKISPLAVSLEQSLWFLHKYVGEAAEKDETLDEVLVPMIEHSLEYRESKSNKQAMILLNWLFQDEILFGAVVRNLADVISRKEDKFISLGWCTLARGLVEYEISLSKLVPNGIRDKYAELLKVFCPCITHLVGLVCDGSILHGGFELPTRLAVAAADFILSLTIALTRNDLVFDSSVNKDKSFSSNSRNQPIALVAADRSEKILKTPSRGSELMENKGMKLLLWDHLNDLIILVERLRAWSRKSRSLHSTGLDRVINWLQDTKKRYAYFQKEADNKTLETGILLLSSCWKHYGMLLHLEDYRFSQQYKELMEQYLSGIQFYADNHDEEPAEQKGGGSETVKFFLNCLSLLLGRLDGKLFNTAIAEHGSQLSKVLITQLRCADEEVIDSAVCIFQAAVFRSNSRPSKDRIADTDEMNAVLPLLLHLLDERDGAAKAVVKLVAEYCSLCSDNHCLREVLKRLNSGNVSQRMNAVDVISDLIHISLESISSLSPQIWQDIADSLMKCLGDEELVIQTSASKLIPAIDPSLVLPTLVRLVYSACERVQSLASHALIEVLKNNKDEIMVVCLLLDCLSNLCQDPDFLGAAGKESKLDTDRVLKLLPEWAENVEDWNVVISALLDKLFAEPSNAVIVRFLSFISENLADLADLVFHRLLLYTARHKDTEESVSKWENKISENTDALERQNSLFSRLCPLLVIRLLPLRVFNELNSSVVYGQHFREHVLHDTGSLNVDGMECIGALLIHRALDRFEFEDVRKLAAELCGRIHPHVLIPIISSQLECAAKTEDTLKIKTCLFSICTSLMIRGKDSYQHPCMSAIRKTIEFILSLPCTNGDDVLKAQHGCIDCLAWMMVTEVEISKVSKSPTSDEGSIVQQNSHSENETLESLVSAYVIHRLTHNDSGSFCGRSNRVSGITTCLSFRLCMANVLISACQKISDSGKKPLAQKIVPPIIRSSQVIVEPSIRAACNQVLFSVVYHLKSAVLAYSSDILKVALQSLRDGSEEERMSGARLLASLMASEEAVVRSLSGSLLEAVTMLQSISSSDPSVVVRQLCQKLLSFMTVL